MPMSWQRWWVCLQTPVRKWRRKRRRRRRMGLVMRTMKACWRRRRRIQKMNLTPMKMRRHGQPLQPAAAAAAAHQAREPSARGGTGRRSCRFVSGWSVAGVWGVECGLGREKLGGGVAAAGTALGGLTVV
jgi:hypothetical protein